MPRHHMFVALLPYLLILFSSVFFWGGGKKGSAKVLHFEKKSSFSLKKKKSYMRHRWKEREGGREKELLPVGSPPSSPPAPSARKCLQRWKLGQAKAPGRTRSGLYAVLRSLWQAAVRSWKWVSVGTPHDTGLT